MYYVHFDSGTTNSRIYLLNEKLEVVAEGKKSIGSKDSALEGCNLVLIDALKDLYDTALKQAGIEDAQVKGIYASGMVTSPYGLEEVPHLLTPLPLSTIAENIHIHRETHRFGRDIYLIKGVRTGEALSDINQDNIQFVNNMRGEEIEILGIWSSISSDVNSDPCIVINPGSHTHSSYIEKCILKDIYSTFSGELYHAITTGTIIAGAIDNLASPDFDAAYNGYLALEENGFNRALYICHAQRLFEVGSSSSRQSFLEGVLMGSMVSGIRNLCNGKWKGAKKIFVAESGDVSKFLVYLLKKVLSNLEVLELPPENSGSFVLSGFREILGRNATG